MKSSRSALTEDKDCRKKHGKKAKFHGNSRNFAKAPRTANHEGEGREAAQSTSLLPEDCMPQTGATLLPDEPMPLPRDFWQNCQKWAYVDLDRLPSAGIAGLGSKKITSHIMRARRLHHIWPLPKASNHNHRITSSCRTWWSNYRGKGARHKSWR